MPRKNEPVEITEIKVGNNAISLGQSFLANSDWVSDLTFKVRNISAKDIAWVELQLQFPEVRFNKAIFVQPIRYGQVPDLPEDSRQDEPPVAPNETVQMQLDSDSYGGLKRIVADSGMTLGITKVRILTSIIIFVDGTSWHLGFFHIRDPNNPRRWIRISDNISRIKTPYLTVGFFDSTPLVT